MTPNESIPNDEGGVGAAEQHAWTRRFKFTASSLFVALVLVGGMEFAVRLFGWDRERMQAPLLPALDAQFRAVHRSDPLLFFALRPNATGRFNGVTVATNSLGLRSGEIGPKGNDEFRILSLGESTAFGAGVEIEDTYAALLQKLLNQASRGEKYTVINAAVSAYTSFQSGKYLEHRGRLLRPDLVLIYHEFNDFLPTTNREALAPDRLGLPLSDRQLFESRSQNLNRRLLEWSALYRLISQLLMEYRVDRFPGSVDDSNAEHIRVPRMLREVSTPDGLRELNLPARVPVADRRDNLESMLFMCESIGAQLVVLHPSYSESKRHECDLTEFCRDRNVPIFEVYDCLHPEGAPPGAMYWDLWHPNAQGHACIGNGLFEFLMANGLVPAAVAEVSATPASPGKEP